MEKVRGTCEALGSMRSSDELAAFLGEALGAPVRVRLGRSRSQPVQARGIGYTPFAQGGVELRLHRLFQHAGEDVLLDLARWLAVGKRARAASARLDQYIAKALAELPQSPPRRMAICSEGSVFDLQELQTDLLETELAQSFRLEPGQPALRHEPGQLPFRSEPAQSEGNLPRAPSITWGRDSTKARPKSLRLGSFVAERNLIRIHPRLDREGVPRLFIRFIVFHELLHALYPSKKDPSGRWIHHTRAFRAREREYGDYQAALAWEKRHLFRVLSIGRR